MKLSQITSTVYGAFSGRVKIEWPKFVRSYGKMGNSGFNTYTLQNQSSLGHGSITN